MTRALEDRLGALSAASAGKFLHGGLRGIEKESLRVTADGYIAATAHPPGLGSALEHRFITTDYSEALLEFVTPPVTAAWEAIQFLCDIHQFVFEQIGDELLWAMSMPCMIRSESDVPLARYGTSNVGTMKTVYRRGLGYRYGRNMQAISGIHLNYSLPEAFWPVYQDSVRRSADSSGFRSSAYLGLVRNVRRLDWLLLYLFGASPAVCRTFLAGVETDLDSLDNGTLYGRYATSLRMSEIGYQNSNQAALHVSANSLDEYIRDLQHAVRTPNPEYARIGVEVDGVYRQLNANYLQIENEYYSTVRPKRVARSGERPSEALRRGGVEYVELRALDISPFDPVGINRTQVNFLEAFLVYCLLKDSPPIDAGEQRDNRHNQAAAARHGREPGLALHRDGAPCSLRDWGLDVCREMQMVAELLEGDGGNVYAKAIAAQIEALEDPGRTPSAQVIDELESSGRSVFEFAMDLSRNCAAYFRAMPADMNTHYEILSDESRESLRRQARIEADDDIGFEEYLQNYFS
ncbi:MAG: glutamate--cysteine ligase [Gammaproteobacteria bacterium]